MDLGRVISAGSGLIGAQRNGVIPAGAQRVQQPEPGRDGTLQGCPAWGCQHRAPLPACGPQPSADTRGGFAGERAWGETPEAWKEESTLKGGVAARRGRSTSSSLHPPPWRSLGDEPAVLRSWEHTPKPAGIGAPSWALTRCAAGGPVLCVAPPPCAPDPDPGRVGLWGLGRPGVPPATLGGAGRRRGPGRACRARSSQAALSTADSARCSRRPRTGSDRIGPRRAPAPHPGPDPADRRS